MFGKKKAAGTSFEEKIRAAKYERILQSLNDILKTDIKTVLKDGREVTDYAVTCSAMKTKARLAIDFVADLEETSDE